MMGRNIHFTFYIRLTTWYGWNGEKDYKNFLWEIYENNSLVVKRVNQKTQIHNASQL